MRGLFIAIAIGLFAPISCSRAVSMPMHYLETSDHRIIPKCYKKCLMLKPRHRNKLKDETSYMEGCFHRCTDRQMEKDNNWERRPRDTGPALYSHSLQPSKESTSYAVPARVFKVDCRKAGNFTAKAFIVYWELPKNYLHANYTHFEVKYMVVQKGVIPDPFSLMSRNVDKNTLSYTVENVDYVNDETDTLQVLVLPVPSRDIQIDAMQTFHPCLPAKSPTTPRNLVTKDPVRAEIVVGASVAIAMTLAFLVYVIYKKLRSAKPSQASVGKGKIYVSYFPDSEADNQRLLELVASLRSVHHVNLIMDSFCQEEVADLGLPRWCQTQLSGSTRVLMVISKGYLEVLEKWQSDLTDMLEANDVNVHRVCCELLCIFNRMFEKKRNSFLTILLDDVTQDKLPNPFRCMKSFAWPEGEGDSNSLVCSLSGTEFVVVV